MASGITTSWLRGAYTGGNKVKSDSGSRGAGQLVARRMRTGVLFYFRHSPEKGKEVGASLGPYDERGIDGLTLVQARERAAELAKVYRSGVTDIRGYLAEQKEAAAREKREAAAAVARAAEAAQRSTLRQLLDVYVAHLERAGKTRTAGDTESIFTKHVYKADPVLAARKAAEVTVDEFVQLIARVVEAGKGRTAAKLRSGLRAAFGLAIRARTDPAAPQSLRSFGVTGNPVADIGALANFNRTRDRHLNAAELGAFLRRIDAMPEGPRQDALRLTLLLGGQRPMQLLRLKAADVDLTAGTITLHDSKGARKQPRVHVLPLVKEAQAILDRRLEALRKGEPVFSIDREHAIRIETLGGAVAKIMNKMLKADPPEAREAFQLRDLRRTCETQMAGLKVSSDIRAQIQSHGLGGIQIRHYDRHSYAVEKRAALEKWARHLAKLKAGEQATVTELRPGLRDKSKD